MPLQWISTDSRSPVKEGLPPTKRRSRQLEMKTGTPVCRKGSEVALSDSGESLTVQGPVSLSPRFAQHGHIPLDSVILQPHGGSHISFGSPKKDLAQRPFKPSWNELQSLFQNCFLTLFFLP